MFHLKRCTLAFMLCSWSTNIFLIFKLTELGESRDKLIVGASALLAASTFYVKDLDGIFRKKYFKSLSLLSFLLVTVLGFLPEERHLNIFPDVNLSRILWCGFGPAVFFSLICIAMPFAGTFFTKEGKVEKWRKSIAIGASFLVLLSFAQEALTVIDQGHSEYIMNEMFSFVAGNAPYANFIPQYQSFYGLVLIPVSGIMTGFQLIEMSFFLFFVLAFIAIFLLVSLGRKCLPTKSWITSILLIVPFIGVTPFGIRINFTGSIAALLSAYPIRLLPGLILITIFTNSFIETNKSRRIGKIHIQVLIGLVEGIILWQQQDFGIAAVFAVQVALLVEPTTPLKPKIQRALVISSSAILTTILILEILNEATMGLNGKYIAFFNRQFSGGFGSELIELPGPAMVILPLIFSLMVFHTNKLIKNNYDEFNLRSSLIGFTVTLWAIACLPYYVNRSFASGQLQILLGLLGLSITVTVSYHLDEIKAYSDVRKYYNLRSDKLFLRGLIALPVALMLLLPNPAFDLYRFYRGVQEPRFLNEKIVTTVDDLKRKKAFLNESEPSSSIAYLGSFGNWIQFETGVQSVNIFNSPYDWLISPASFDLGCKHLAKNLPDYIYLDSKALGLFTTTPKEDCGLNFDILPNQHLYRIAR